MAEASAKNNSESQTNKSFLVCLARAFGGALIFSFPMLMTMEMWHLGFYMDRFRLALFMFLAVPLLVGLSYYDGFEDTFTTKDDVIDAFVAYAVGFAAAAVILFLFGQIKAEMSADEIIGKISLQAVTAALGSMFAQSLLGGDDDSKKDSDEKKRSANYFGQLFLMIVGAVFLSMSLAMTEEMVLISYQMSDLLSAALAIFTILLMHGFVYAAEFAGHEKHHSPDTPFWSVFLRFTVVGYAIVLLVSFYILWTFGSLDGLGFEEQLKAVIVLGLPAALGASASRLIL
ncbi:MAG: TIGR02587 family membrane protein [Acidobacteriota bacterium]|nr:TIGR02587 family membrane protein [Acidobacteriota bacterium]